MAVSAHIRLACHWHRTCSLMNVMRVYQRSFASFEGESTMTSATRPLAIVTGASSGIGYELAKCCAEQGFDLLIAADQPTIYQAAQEFRALGAAVEAVEADLAMLEGVDTLRRSERPTGRGAARQRGARPGARLPRPGFHDRAARDRHQHHRHHVFDPESGEGHARPPSGAHPHHRLRRRLHAGLVSGGLQRHQSLPQFVLVRAAERIARHQRDGDVSDAGRDRD